MLDLSTGRHFQLSASSWTRWARRLEKASCWRPRLPCSRSRTKIAATTPSPWTRSWTLSTWWPRRLRACRENCRCSATTTSLTVSTGRSTSGWAKASVRKKRWLVRRITWRHRTWPLVNSILLAAGINAVGPNSVGLLVEEVTDEDNALSTNYKRYAVTFRRLGCQVQFSKHKQVRLNSYCLYLKRTCTLFTEERVSSGYMKWYCSESTWCQITYRRYNMTRACLVYKQSLLQFPAWRSLSFLGATRTFSKPHFSIWKLYFHLLFQL